MSKDYLNDSHTRQRIKRYMAKGMGGPDYGDDPWLYDEMAEDLLRIFIEECREREN